MSLRKNQNQAFNPKYKLLEYEFNLNMKKNDIETVNKKLQNLSTSQT